MNRAVVWPALMAVLLVLQYTAFSQGTVPFNSKDNDTVRTIYIWHSDTLREMKKDSLTSIQSLFGHVKLQEGKTVFFSDSVSINQKDNLVEAFRNVHIIDSDTTNIYSQYMKYFVDKKQIIFQKDVKLTDGKGVLTTDELHYDLNQRIGDYYNGGKVFRNGTVITSREGTYYAETKDVYFKKDVVLTDPAYNLKADSLLYNTDTQIATFITYTVIRDSSGRTIRTKEGYYDLGHHKASFGRRPKITDGSQTVIGDIVNFDDSTGYSTAIGHAVYRDTAQGIVILGNRLIADKKKGTLLATEKPLAIIKQDNDSLYLTADTLFSGKIADTVVPTPEVDTTSIEGAIRAAQRKIEVEDSTLQALRMSQVDSIPKFPHFKYPDSLEAVAPPLKLRKEAFPVIAQKQKKGSKPLLVEPVPVPESPRDTTNAAVAAEPQKTDSSRRYILGYHHVRIFSDSIQAVADSMYYSGIDSVFQLFTDPIVWASGRQITGDTIYMYTQNKKPKRLYVWENALAVNKSGRNMYDQLKGNTINGYFKNGEFDYLRAKGSAEAIYYIKDDSMALVGVNKVNKADIIDLLFQNKELDKVVLRNDADGTMYPIRKVKLDEMRLRNFRWLEDRRPKSKYELMGD